MIESKFQHYYPAIFLGFLAFFFAVFPSIAAFLVVLFLFSFALLYAFVIYRFHRFHEAMRKHQSQSGEGARVVDSDDFSDFTGDFQNPSFSEVTVFLTRRGKKLRDFRF